MKPALRQIFPQGTKLSHGAQKLFIFLAGFERITGKLPDTTRVELPATSFQDVDELLIELSDEGYIQGTPQKFTLNFTKVAVTTKSLHVNSKPMSMLDLLDKYKKLHTKHFKCKMPSGEKDLLQLRHLVRQFSADEVSNLIPAFFHDDKIRGRKGPFKLDVFFLWATNHLRKKYGVKIPSTNSLGKVKKRTKR